MTLSWRVIRAAPAALLLMSPLVGARAETITVTHWGAQFYGAPYAVAREKGFFKEAGVDISGFLTSTGGGTSVRNTLASDLPYGEVALSAALEAIKAGQPLKIVNGGVESIGDLLWIAKADSPLTGIKDLLGKRVGFTSPGSVSNMLLLMSLKHAGIDLKSVQIVPAGGIGANLSAVLSGALDAALTSEPVWTQERAKIKPVFWAKDELGPDMTQTVGVVTEEFGKSQPDKIRAIIAGRAKGVDYVYAHLEEAADITAKAYNMDPALVRTVFQHLKEMQWWRKGDLHYQAMDRMVEGMQVVGKLTGSIDWSKIVDTSFLPKDLQPKS
jgi:NitT/TauT family transport system substrate-binding protein